MPVQEADVCACHHSVGSDCSHHYYRGGSDSEQQKEK